MASRRCPPVSRRVRISATSIASSLSQELRLTSPKNDGQLIDYVLGAYYLHAKTDEVTSRTITTLPGPITPSGQANYGMTNDNYALFGEANVNFSNAFRASNTVLAAGGNRKRIAAERLHRRRAGRPSRV